MTSTNDTVQRLYRDAQARLVQAKDLHAAWARTYNAAVEANASQADRALLLTAKPVTLIPVLPGSQEFLITWSVAHGRTTWMATHHRTLFYLGGKKTSEAKFLAALAEAVEDQRTRAIKALAGV